MGNRSELREQMEKGRLALQIQRCQDHLEVVGRQFLV